MILTDEIPPPSSPTQTKQYSLEKPNKLRYLPEHFMSGTVHSKL